MRTTGTQRWRWLLLSAAALACGCNNDDAARLARVGRMVTAKAETLTAGAEGKFSKAWQALRGGWNEDALDARVSQRLRWDKSLADSPIQVNVSANVVKLTGNVTDLAQRRRAVELAESTVGVEKVIDALEGPKTDP